MSFEYKYRLLLLLIPAVLVVVYALYWRWKHRRMRELGDPELFAAMVASRSGRQEVAAFCCAAVALSLIGFALAGPQWGDAEQRVQRRGIDVVFALDISRSMLAEDIPPSRLAAAKTEIERVLNELDGDRVGLVAFAGIAFTQCPLTSDYTAIRRFLRNLDPDDLPIQGTAIGRAINESIHLLEGRRDEKSEPSQMERGHDQIIVLFTDGEDHDTVPAEAAALARERGIRVMTVALGTEGGSEIPQYDGRGNRQGSLRYRGEVVISRMAPDALDDIASAGGGIAITYGGEGSVVAALASEIDRLEDAELETILSRKKEDRFYVFVAPALLLLLIAFGLSDRKRGAPHIGWLSSSLLIGLFLSGCADTFLYESDEVEEGLELTASGEFDEGIEQIRDFRDSIAPEDLIDAASLAYVEGVALLQANRLDGARSKFLAALGSQDETVRFRSYFNLGNISYLEANYTDARYRFTQALDLRPDDVDAKWNLEMTLRQLFPPCSTLEDELEENDRPEEAAEWPTAPSAVIPGMPAPPSAGPEGEEEEAPSAVLCGGDTDWFVLPNVLDGGFVSVSLELKRLRDDTGGAELPTEIPSDSLSLTIYEGDAQTILGNDLGLDETGEPGMMDALEVSRRVTNVQIPAGGAPNGFVFIEIDAHLGLEFEYELEMTFSPPCYALEEEQEDNDNRNSATPLQVGELPLHHCPTDDDWFSFFAFAGDSVFIDIQGGPPTSVIEGEEISEEEPEHSIGLRADLYRVGENTPIQTVQGRDGILELGEIELLEGGDFLVRVSDAGSQTEGPYLLNFYRFAPCIAGDDDYEENDDLRQAAMLDPAEAPFRHLRLCPEDIDWFLLPVLEDQHISLSVEYEEPERIVGLALTAPGTATVIASGTATDAPQYPPSPPGVLGPPTPRARYSKQIFIEEPEAEGDYGVRVTGDPGFYNITFPTPNPPPPSENPEPQDGDGEGEPQDGEQEAENEEQGEPEEQEQQPQPEDGEQEQQELEFAQELESADERLRQLLDSLNDEDVNLQLHQALQNLPPVQTDREW